MNSLNCNNVCLVRIAFINWLWRTLVCTLYVYIWLHNYMYFVLLINWMRQYYVVVFYFVHTFWSKIHALHGLILLCSSRLCSLMDWRWFHLFFVCVYEWILQWIFLLINNSSLSWMHDYHKHFLVHAFLPCANSIYNWWWWYLFLCIHVLYCYIKMLHQYIVLFIT